MTGRSRVSFPERRVDAFPRSGTLACALLAAAVALLLAIAAPATRAADSGRGAGLYQQHCAVCHGSGGRPTWPGTPDFRRATNLMKPDGNLLVVIRNGKGVMPGYIGILKDRDMLDVLAYLRTLG